MEGVETPSVLEAVVGIGIPEIQGFAIARPLPQDEVGRFMTETDLVSIIQRNPTSWLSAYAIRLNVRESEILLGPWRKRYDASVVGDVTMCQLYEIFGRDSVVADLHEKEHKALARVVEAYDRQSALVAEREMKTISKVLDEALRVLVKEEVAQTRRNQSQVASPSA